MNLKLIFIGFISASVVACSHENALLTQDKETTARFLVKADLYAEKKLKPRHHTGNDYRYCIDGTIVDRAYCNDLYQVMLDYAKGLPNSPYHKISVNDLSDPSVFMQVGDYYKAISFSLPPENPYANTILRYPR